MQWTLAAAEKRAYWYTFKAELSCSGIAQKFDSKPRFPHVCTVYTVLCEHLLWGSRYWNVWSLNIRSPGFMPGWADCLEWTVQVQYSNILGIKIWNLLAIIQFLRKNIQWPWVHVLNPLNLLYKHSCLGPKRRSDLSMFWKYFSFISEVPNFETSP